MANPNHKVPRENVDMVARDPWPGHRRPYAQASSSFAGSSSYPASSAWPSSAEGARGRLATHSPARVHTTQHSNSTVTTTRSLYSDQHQHTLTVTATPTNLADGTQHHASGGVLAAAVVVPLLFILCLFGVGWCLYKRRANRQVQLSSETPATTLTPSPSSASSTPRAPGNVRFSAAAIKRSFQSSTRSSRRTSRQPPMTQQPTNPTDNPSYFTGLDTWSRTNSTRSEYRPRISAGGTTYEDPPPPYNVPAEEQRVHDPFEDPEDDRGVADGFAGYRQQHMSVLSEAVTAESLDETLYAESWRDPFRDEGEENSEESRTGRQDGPG